ncbi:MAG: hypothetical protein WC587_01545 [Candidatus Paceibacterota bacterium]
MASKKFASKKIFLNVAAIIFSLGIISVANAVNPFDISYPVAELGNCGSQEECKSFCDNPDNQVACVEWAQGKGFVTEGEVKRVKDMRRFDDGAAPIEDFGPNGCKTPQECDAFCKVLENLNECLSYSVSHGYMPQEEADKILAKVNKGGPGGCKGPQECDTFCRNPENIETCMNFAVEDGKISKEEADFIITQTKEFGAGHGRKGGAGKSGQQRGPAEPKIDEQKALKVLEEKGGGPGGCKSMEECGNYCGTPEHGEECMNFAVENGFMPPEEMEKAKKMMTMAGPGGCKGPQECDAYCSQEGHGEECMNFSLQNGLVSPEEGEKMKREMEIVKKLQGGGMSGPGGCKGPQECQAYCSDQSHMEECMSFATQNGMMNRGDANMRMQQVQDAQSMIQMGEQSRQRFMMPPQGGLPDGKAGEMGPPPEGFRGFMSPPPGSMQPPPQGGMLPPEGYQMPPQGIMPPTTGGGFVPPGGFIPPPYGSMQPPPGMMQPANMMPPEGMIQPPPTNMIPPPPSELMPSTNLPGLILKPFLDIFRAW